MSSTKGADTYDFYILSEDAEWEKQVLQELKKIKPEIKCLTRKDWKPGEYKLQNVIKPIESCKKVVVGFTSKPTTGDQEFVAATAVKQMLDSNALNQRKLIPVKITEDAEVPSYLKPITAANGWEDSFYDNLLKVLHSTDEPSPSGQLYSSKVQKIRSYLLQRQQMVCFNYRHFTPPIMQTRYQLDIKHMFTNLDIVKQGKQESTPITLIDMLNIIKSKPACRVLIEGEGGIGKTTLLRCLAYNWSDKLDNTFAGKIVFLVNIRDIGEGEDVLDVIVKQMRLNDFSRKTNLPIDLLIKRFLITHDDEIVLMVDGLDELEKGSESPIRIFRKKELQRSIVLITSRSGNNNEFIKTSDMHLKVKGFGDGKIEEYIQRYFKYNPDKAVSLNIQLNHAHRELHSMLRNPMLLLLICIMWEERQEIPSNKADLFREIFQCILNQYNKNKMYPKVVFFEDIPRRYVNAMCVLGQCMYHRLKKNQLLINKRGLKGDTDAVELALKLGFVYKDESFSRTNFEEIYTAPHKLIVEALVGFYLCKLCEDAGLYNFSSLNDHEWEKIYKNKYLWNASKFAVGFLGASADKFLKNLITSTSSLSTYRTLSIDYLHLVKQEHVGAVVQSLNKYIDNSDLEMKQHIPDVCGSLKMLIHYINPNTDADENESIFLLIRKIFYTKSNFKIEGFYEEMSLKQKGKILAHTILAVNNQNVALKGMTRHCNEEVVEQFVAECEKLNIKFDIRMYILNATTTASYFGYLLSHSPNLINLYVQDNVITGSIFNDAIKMCSSKVRNLKLWNLKISDNNLRNIDGTSLASLVNPQMSTLNMHNCNLTGDIINDMMRECSSRGIELKLKDFDISGNNLSSIDPISLASIMNPQMRRLNMHNCNLTGDVINDMMRECSSRGIELKLKYLDITGNNLGIINAISLASIMNPQVSRLNIHNCNLTGDVFNDMIRECSSRGIMVNLDFLQIRVNSSTLTLIEDFSKVYKGKDLNMLKFILLDIIPWEISDNCNRVFTLFAQLLRQGAISHTDVELLSEIGDLTEFTYASIVLYEYKQETNYKPKPKGTKLTPYRKVLYKAIQELDWQSVYNVKDHYGLPQPDYKAYTYKIWDEAILWERCDIFSREGIQVFANCVNQRAHYILLDIIPTGDFRSIGSISQWFQEFKQQFSEIFPGDKIRFLLYEHLDVEVLTRVVSVVDLLDELCPHYISYSDVNLLSEISELTQNLQAKILVKKYTTTYEYNAEGDTRLSDYRKELFTALMATTKVDLEELVNKYNLHDCGVDNNIWDLVFYLEKENLLEDTPDKIEKFGMCLNEHARSKLLENRKIPIEIIAEGPAAVEAYKKAKEYGSKPFYQTRLMVVGQERVGKTSLIKALTGKGFDKEEQITDGVNAELSVIITHTTGWKNNSEDFNIAQQDFNEALETNIAIGLQKEQMGKIEYQGSLTDKPKLAVKPAFKDPEVASSQEKPMITKDEVKPDTVLIDQETENLDQDKPEATKNVVGPDKVPREAEKEHPDQTVEDKPEATKNVAEPDKVPREAEKEHPDQTVVDKPEATKNVVEPDKVPREAEKKHPDQTVVDSTSSIVEVDIQRDTKSDSKTVPEIEEEKEEDEQGEEEEKEEDEKKTVSVGGETIMDKAVRKAKSCPDFEQIEWCKDLILSIWDFAGQDLYYITHQVFLVSRAIYIICFNLCRGLDDYAEIEVHKLEHGKVTFEHHMTNVEFIFFWLRSIHSTTIQSANKQQSPAVIIVGTHRESLPGNAEEKLLCAKKKLEAVKEKLKGTTYEYLVDEESCFAIDNSLDPVDKAIEELKSYITELAKKQPYMGEGIPVKWLEFFTKVEQLRKTKSTIKFNEVEELAKACAIEDDALFIMLKFSHNLGYIVYYGEPDTRDSPLNDLVILDRKWLIKIFRKVFTYIRDPEWDKFESLWKKLSTKGIMEEKLLKHLLAGPEDEYDEQFESLLELMQEFHLLLEIKDATGTHKESGRCFYVPSLLGDKQRKVMVDKKRTKSVVMLYIGFEGFLSEGMFYRLLVMLLKWSQDNGGKAKLFHHQGQLSLDDSHEMILSLWSFKRTFIQVAIFQRSSVVIGNGDETEPSPAICKMVLELLEEKLDNLGKTYRKKLDYYFFVLCNTCNKEKQLIECLQHDKIQCKSRMMSTKKIRKFFGDWKSKHDSELKTDDFEIVVTPSQISTGRNVIDADGGFLTHDKTRLQIKSGALNEKEHVKISVKNSCHEEKLLDLQKYGLRVSPVVRCGPSRHFNQPCTLKLPHNVKNYEDCKFSLLFKECESNTWKEISIADKEDTKFSIEEGYCIIETNHFSKFVLYCLSSIIWNRPKFNMGIFGMSLTDGYRIKTITWKINDEKTEKKIIKEAKRYNEIQLDSYQFEAVTYSDDLDIEVIVTEGWKPKCSKETIKSSLMLEGSPSCRFIFKPVDASNPQPCDIIVKLKQKVCQLCDEVKLPEINEKLPPILYRKNEKRRRLFNISEVPVKKTRMEDIFREFLQEFCDCYDGSDYLEMRFLLCDKLNISDLSCTEATGMKLCNKMIRQGIISCNNVKVFLEISELTKSKKAKEYVENYTKNIQQCTTKEVTVLSTCRCTLFNALKQSAGADLKKLNDYYNKDLKNVWDLVFQLEIDKKLDNTKEKWIRFAKRLNKTAKEIMLGHSPPE